MSLTDYLKPVTRKFTTENLFLDFSREGRVICLRPPGGGAHIREESSTIGPLPESIASYELPGGAAPRNADVEPPLPRELALVLRALEVGFAMGAVAGRNQIAGLIAELNGAAPIERAAPRPPRQGWY